MPASNSGVEKALEISRIDAENLEGELKLLNQEFYLLKAVSPFDEDDTTSIERYSTIEARLNEIVDELARRRYEQDSRFQNSPPGNGSA